MHNYLGLYAYAPPPSSRQNLWQRVSSPACGERLAVMRLFSYDSIAESSNLVKRRRPNRHIDADRFDLIPL
jgi:hypothetical protein